MNHAARVLRAELGWLNRARHNLVGDLDNARIPAGLVAAQLAQVDREIDEVEYGIYACEEFYSEQGQLAFDFDPAEGELVAA